MRHVRKILVATGIASAAGFAYFGNPTDVRHLPYSANAVACAERYAIFDVDDCSSLDVDRSGRLEDPADRRHAKCLEEALDDCDASPGIEG